MKIKGLHGFQIGRLSSYGRLERDHELAAEGAEMPFKLLGDMDLVSNKSRRWRDGASASSVDGGQMGQKILLH